MTNSSGITLSSLSPELQILLYCSHTTLDESKTSQLEKLLSQQVDWSRLLALAERHGLTPLVQHSLTSLPQISIPDEIRQQLTIVFLQNTANVLLLKGELEKILTVLEQANIPVVIHKGVTLGARIYESATLRDAGDIDILVPAEWIRETIQRLLTIGYEPLYSLSPRQEQKYLRADHHYALVNRLMGVLLEVHWDIADFSQAISVDWPGIWERTDWIELSLHKNNYTIRIFTPEDEMLLLAIHGSLHRWERLKWLVDINEFILRHPHLDWSVLMHRAQDWRIRRIVLMSLYLSKKLLATPLSSQIEKSIKLDTQIQSLSKHVIKLLDTAKSPPQPDGHRVLFVMRLRENWQDKLAYIWRLPTRLL